jgi:F0F1-type ATP synthase assembly protein I
MMVIVEFAAPLLLLARSDRARVALVVLLLGFHLMTFTGVRIIFLPHCVAMLFLLRWERLPKAARRLRSRAGVGRPAEVEPAGVAPPN